MKKSSQYFTEVERKNISKAVQEAELKTSAEIIPVAVTSSGRYDRAEDIIGLLIGIVVMVNVLAFMPEYDRGGVASWSDNFFQQIPFTLYLIASLIAGFMVGVIVSNRLAWLKNYLLHRLKCVMRLLVMLQKFFMISEFITRHQNPPFNFYFFF